jgi:hypothetical protein
MAEIKAKKVILRNRDGEHLIPVIEDKMGLALFDTVLKDYVLTYKESKGLALQGTYVYKDAIAGSRYGYPDFYEKCLKERDEAIANGGVQKVTLGGTTMSMYIHPNGHMYYNISMKSTVDSWFNTFGTAWFYGVDTENERIFLPRTLWFEQMTNDKTQVGLSVDAGLPNITGGFAVGYGSSGGANSSLGKAIYTSSTVCNMHAGAGTNNSKDLALDASKSSSVYGNSTTVQPKAVKKLLYICVGNTVSDTSWVDVVTQVEGGVKDLEDKTLEGIERLKASSTSLTQTQITNCLLEVPQRIKYDLTDGVLTIKAGSVVIVPYGVEDLTAQYPVGSTFLNDNYKVADTQYEDGKFFVWAELQSDVANSKTVTDTKERFIWISTSTNEIEAAVDVASGTSTTGTALFYDTDNNTVDYYNSGVASGKVMALPLGIVTSNGVNKFALINQVFNGMGYIGSTVWVDKGVKGLIPNGRNEDGSLRNFEYTTNTVAISDRSVLDGENRAFLLNYKKNVLEDKTYSEDNKTIAGSGQYIYNPITNYIYNSGGTKGLWVLCGLYTSVNGQITSFNPKQPFRAVDYNDKATVSGYAMPSNKYIDLTLGASGTDYTAPANGYFTINKTASATNQSLQVINKQNQMAMNVYSTSSSSVMRGFVPVLKGQKCRINYSLGGTTTLFRFVYAEGEA